MINALVSVVIPTYKRPLALKNAINSVFMQSYKNLEIVVVDDNNSSDPLHHETKRVVSCYSSVRKIIYLKQEVQQGANAARNAGILASNGEYIAFLDDDDVWFKEKLESQVVVLKKDTHMAFVYCNMMIIYNGGKEVISNFNIDSCSFESLIERGEGVSTSSLMIRKSVLLEAGGFDETLESYQDYDLLLRLSKTYSHALIKSPLLEYKVGLDGISMNYNSKFFGKERVLRKYKEDYIELDKASYYGIQMSLLGQYAILSGRKMKALRYYLTSVINRPAQIKSYLSLVIVIVGGEWLYRKSVNFYYKTRKLSNLVSKKVENSY